MKDKGFEDRTIPESGGQNVNMDTSMAEKYPRGFHNTNSHPGQGKETPYTSILQHGDMRKKKTPQPYDKP